MVALEAYAMGHFKHLVGTPLAWSPSPTPIPLLRPILPITNPFPLSSHDELGRSINYFYVQWDIILIFSPSDPFLCFFLPPNLLLAVPSPRRSARFNPQITITLNPNDITKPD